ncbi:MAG: helix-turn-helix domain-containing protein [Alphaproteobacteria bacterium]|nr:helix-turn-helix domain-containing protein [Alphaproteobacteria bacterium]
MSELSQSLSAAIAFCSVLIAAHIFMARARASVADILLATFFCVLGIQLALLSIHVPTAIDALVRIRALLALLLVPNGYLFVRAMRQTSRWRRRDLVHLLPASAGALAIAVNRSDALDYIVPVTELFYAAAVGRFIPVGEDQFARPAPPFKSRFGWPVVLTALFAMMGLVDAGILVDLARGGLVQNSYILAAGMFGGSAFVAYVMLGALSRPAFVGAPTEAAPVRYARSTLDPSARAALARRVQTVLDDPCLLHDDTLTVARVARRLATPARHVTEAVNLELGRSFSDLLNERRIEAAKALLHSQDHAATSVLEIAQIVGYASKSNFNREFLRRAGVTPSAYRRSIPAGDPIASGQSEIGEISRPQS